MCTVLGVQDHYDVKMPCHLLLAKLAAAAPQRTLEALPRLTAALQGTLLAKVKSDAVKQEVMTPYPSVVFPRIINSHKTA